jgi:hypothetical protein
VDSSGSSPEERAAPTVSVVDPAVPGFDRANLPAGVGEALKKFRPTVA